MKDISLIDLGVILLMLYFVVRGYQQGLIRQTMALIGLLLGLKIASDNYLYVSSFLEANFAIHEAVARVVGFTGILFLVMALVSLIGLIMSGLTKVLLLTFFDRTVGAVLGLIKGGIVVYLCLLLIKQVPYGPVMSQLDKSVIARDLLALTPYIQENINKLIWN